MDKTGLNVNVRITDLDELKAFMNDLTMAFLGSAQQEQQPTGLFKGTFKSRDEVADAMDALDVLGKTYRVTKRKIVPAPIFGDNEWVVEELLKEFDQNAT